MGSRLAWWTLAGITIRPRATSSRMNSGAVVLALRDPPHLRRDHAPAGVVHLGGGLPRERRALHARPPRSETQRAAIGMAALGSLPSAGSAPRASAAPQIRFKESVPRAPSQPPRGAPPANDRRQPMIRSPPSHVAPGNRHRGPPRGHRRARVVLRAARAARSAALSAGLDGGLDRPGSGAGRAPRHQPPRLAAGPRAVPLPGDRARRAAVAGRRGLRARPGAAGAGGLRDRGHRGLGGRGSVRAGCAARCTARSSPCWRWRPSPPPVVLWPRREPGAMGVRLTTWLLVLLGVVYLADAAVRTRGRSAPTAISTRTSRSRPSTSSSSRP